jgi:hypothetical protein
MPQSYINMHIHFDDDGEVDVHADNAYDKHLYEINPFQGILFHHTLYSLINCASSSQSYFAI